VKFGFRAKLFVLSLGLVGGSTLIVFAYARSDLKAQTLLTIEQDLRTRLNLGALELEHWMGHDRQFSNWQPLAKDLAKASGTRVTIIRSDGLVVAESNVDTADLGKLENHRLRPEVHAALSNGIGLSRRHSSTIEHDMLYVATPIGAQDRPFGVLRMALDLGTVQSEVAALQRGVGVGAVLALLLALLTASAAAAWASRATRQLTEVARRMSQGDLEARVPQLGNDEFEELGRTLGQLARSLSTTLSELRLERDRVEGILTRMREGVLLLDDHQRVLLVNPALREMLLLQDDSVGRSVLEVIRHGELKKMLDNVKLTGEGKSQEVEFSGLKPRQLLVRVAPLGAAGGMFAVVLDVTEMRRLESIRRDFVANVSHELRTPVTAIRSAAETIRDVAVNDIQALPRFTDIIARNAERLGSLVDDLLDLSRIESREIRIVAEALDVSMLVSQVVTLFRERAEKRGQSLVVEVPTEVPRILADRRALEHILTNLIDNAVKYSGNGAEIRVRAVCVGTSIEVRVEDTGPGIAEEHLPRLFERFYRVDTGRSRELGGTGLGLSIVKHLVEAMGSNIDVDSEQGTGTRFAFRLPMAPGVTHEERQLSDTSQSSLVGH
jgi:two-component system, OmpR family, phosphate regulon sensor histidine kinase PhoR